MHIFSQVLWTYYYTCITIAKGSCLFLVLLHCVQYVVVDNLLGVRSCARTGIPNFLSSLVLELQLS